MNFLKALVIVFLIADSAPAQHSNRDFVVADSLATRLPPSAFPALPQQVRQMLDHGGYTIPQSWADSLPHNVIFGEFRKKGETDIAVLASKNRISSIVIFWNGSTDDTTHIEPQADLNYMQDEADRGILFSRLIQSVRLTQLTSDCGYQGGKPVPVDHDAIEDYFIPKGSKVIYRYKGKWYFCPGAD